MIEVRSRNQVVRVKNGDAPRKQATTLGVLLNVFSVSGGGESADQMRETRCVFISRTTRGHESCPTTRGFMEISGYHLGLETYLPAGENPVVADFVNRVRKVSRSCGGRDYYVLELAR